MSKLVIIKLIIKAYSVLPQEKAIQIRINESRPDFIKNSTARESIDRFIENSIEFGDERVRAIKKQN